MRLFDQKYRDLVPNGIDPMTNATLKRVLVFVVGQWFLANWAGEDRKQVFVNHGDDILLRFQIRISKEQAFAETERRLVFQSVSFASIRREYRLKCSKLDLLEASHAVRAR
jgi:hypothetical protein